MALGQLPANPDLFFSPPTYFRNYGFRDYQQHPYHGHDERRRAKGDWSASKKLQILVDKQLQRLGDLGWTLDYATAYAYRHIVGARTEIADIIDKIRELDEVSSKTPYFVFDALDRSIFGGKLNGMVYLRWKDQASTATGTTFAPKVRVVPRICIELNSGPFQDEGGDIDVLLDALIHQMIHAWFLVCCGAQQNGVKQDGRLTDGLHFGVILYTIRDLTRDCEHGPLTLTFYSAERRESRRNHSRMSEMYRGLHGQHNRDLYISVDPEGCNVVLPPADGQSHCSHDNRSVRYSQIKNWQVDEYSRAIKLDLEGKGYEVVGLNTRSELVPIHRLRGPPSRSYLELIWDGKRIMIPTDKALKHPSLQKLVALNTSGRELKCPECPKKVLECMYDFVQKGEYWRWDDERPESNGYTTTHGPPIMIGASGNTDPHERLATHVRVFRAANAMLFEELRKYALQRLYDMPTTTGDPTVALREIYGGSSTPHSDLQMWTRKFLARTEQHTSSHYHGRFLSDERLLDADRYGGVSNLEKLVSWYRQQVQELSDKSAAFRDDCKLVQAELIVEGRWPGALSPHPTQGLGEPWHLGTLPRHHRLSDFSSGRERVDDPLGAGISLADGGSRSILGMEDLYGGHYLPDRRRRTGLLADWQLSRREPLFLDGPSSELNSLRGRRTRFSPRADGFWGSRHGLDEWCSS